jgi:hypothetical protein
MSFGKRQPIGFAGVERRRARREQTNVGAAIMLPAGELKCRVMDFSKAGASIAVPTAFGLPDLFELRAGAASYQVRVVRRGLGRVGVRFL